MKNIGIICEYNPFHNGHAKQLRTVHAQDGTCVCLMSGNYVQRGEPAILDKWTRAKAAVLCGADLVLELPVTYALRSAEGFAAGGVEIFDRLGCIDGLSFGSELVDINDIMSAAEALDSTEFSEHLHDALAEGLSFPAARQQALAALGADTAALETPNSILAVEYCKALRRRNSTIVPMLLHRDGDYHGGSDPAAPAASFLRVQSDWTGFVPPEALEVFSGAVRHTAAAGERAWLARLRGIGIDTTFEPDCSVMTVEDDLYQIVFNLTENAIKYNRQDGWVGVSVRRAGDQVELRVEDSGAGIPPESMEHIFERFYRVDKARSRAAGGAGLGLSIVHDMVERSYGTITVQARPGGGTIFTVRFPHFDLEEDET